MSGRNVSGGSAKRKIKNKSGRNVFNSMTVIVIMLIFVGIIAFQIKDLKSEDSELTERSQKYEKEYEAESERTSELEQQRIKVQTKEYIEEAARKLGFVYPDEIILKPSEK